MVTPIKIPDFQQSRSIVDREGRPFPAFLRGINTAFRVLVNNANATNAALEAAGIAQAAAVAANIAASDAQDAATATTEASALANSYVTGLTVTATDAGTDCTITISAHNRVYAYVPPTNVAVNGGSLTGKAYSTTFYIYYDQPTRAGGAVTYVATTNSADVAQLNNRHSVAQVVTPASGGGATNGGGSLPPGANFKGF
jgi:hypothetical protein